MGIPLITRQLTEKKASTAKNHWKHSCLCEAHKTGATESKKIEGSNIIIALIIINVMACVKLNKSKNECKICMHRKSSNW